MGERLKLRVTGRGTEFDRHPEVQEMATLLNRHVARALVIAYPTWKSGVGQIQVYHCALHSSRPLPTAVAIITSCACAYYKTLYQALSMETFDTLYFPRLAMASLSVPRERSFDSPGSSVFDLPTQPPEAAPERLAPVPLLGASRAPRLPSAGHAVQPSASYVVISGGTGGNAICSAFGDACFVLPVSDDGGSSSEIIRVLGGPSVGDIRSRLVRLIPGGQLPTSPLHAIRNLLAYRLPSKYTAKEAREEWRDIAHILPVIVTNHVVTIAAELDDGERLVGQCEISHPVPSSSESTMPDELVEDGIGSLAELQPQNIMYQQDKDKAFEPLPCRISRLYYINSYGMEIHPSPNPDFIANLQTRDVLVYSCGSLWTSIMPCLAIRGVASAIAGSQSLQAKVLLLNAENDRETNGYTAVDYINAIVRTLNTNYSAQQYGLGNANTTYPVSAFITDLIYLKGSKVNVNEAAIRKLGIRCTEVGSLNRGADLLRFDAETVRGILAEVWAERKEETCMS
ncbi:hypothetical protein D9611_003383 [Ephemerocybe angulata]|uniref:Uncharacterized protein n=1 Tax=Ephemerocybe angulata TaxID=980116 RepID=A0A8H5FHF8_9AGAR|nr:hypothetical protein D9611_003383 [Tulosesus angulatus]